MYHFDYHPLAIAPLPKVMLQDFLRDFLISQDFFTGFLVFHRIFMETCKTKRSHKNSCKMVGVAFENVKRDKCILLFKHLYNFF